MILVSSPVEVRTDEMGDSAEPAIAWMLFDGTVPYTRYSLVQAGSLVPAVNAICAIEANDYAPIIAACTDNGWQYEQ